MSDPTPTPAPLQPTPAANEFEQEAARPQVGLLQEFGEFLYYNASWWITPIVVVMLLLGGLVWVSGTSLMPFVYTMF